MIASAISLAVPGASLPGAAAFLAVGGSGLAALSGVVGFEAGTVGGPSGLAAAAAGEASVGTVASQTPSATIAVICNILTARAHFGITFRARRRHMRIAIFGTG